jgi:asparagine synthase (glutamine-hydrolysing)
MDLDVSANQPMCDESGRHYLVFNGEIYNFPEMRRELLREGFRFRTHSDTEVLLYACMTWGEACLSRLNGMFAFAYWDSACERLLLARDRLGEKPLYWMPLAGGGVAFASELRALRLHPQVSTDLNPCALSQFLSLNYVLSDRCMAVGVRKLPAAHWFSVSRQRISEPKRYWDLAAAFRTKAIFESDAEACEALREKLDAAVVSRLASDVPLGAFLSGGLDSSAIVEAMRRLRPGQRTVTLSMGFADDDYSELPKARYVAEYLAAEHHERVAEQDSATGMEAAMSHADEPFADSSFVPTFHLCRFARGHVTVALSGDGGDELFAGYETYAADRVRRLTAFVPAGVSRGLAALLHSVWPTDFGKVSTEYKLKKFFAGHELDPSRAHYFWRTIFSRDEQALLLRPEWREAVLRVDPFDSFLEHFNEVRDCNWLDQALYVDIKTWLVDDILYKVDRASMAHGLEVRAPFLDHRLVEFAASLPPELKMRGFRKKHLLKESLRNRLPDDIINAKKSGFNAPVSRWLTSGPTADMAKSLTLDGAMTAIFDRDAVNRLWQEHETRRCDHGLKLFGLLALALWLSK